MLEVLREREEKIRRFFNLESGVNLLKENALLPELTPEIEAHLRRFNIEWHIIPAENTIPSDEATYRRLFYPLHKGEARWHEQHWVSSYRAIQNGHRKHKGCVLGIETTVKPKYLPNNRQFYGTQYGFEASADPFAQYFGRAGMVSGTRFGHTFSSLQNFIRAVNDDWKTHGLMPSGFRLTICPPVIFNFVGTIFHPEWSLTESLEIGFYRDEHGNAKCYAVGSNAPNDFSYLYEISSDSDWTLLGFRTALVPDL